MMEEAKTRRKKLGELRNRRGVEKIQDEPQRQDEPHEQEDTVSKKPTLHEEAPHTDHTEMDKVTSTSTLEAKPVITVADLFEIAYDNYSSQDLYALLKCVTCKDVEQRMVECEQLLRKQQEGPRVERFLDAISTTRNNGSISRGTNNMEENHNTMEGTNGYEYSVMLQRLLAALQRNKESSALTERNQLPQPQLEKVGKKKVIITNFSRICQVFNRPVEDVKDYIEKELSVRGNLDSNNALILKYVIQKETAFDNIITKYLDEYVKCNSCRRIDTSLTKEGRRMELRCNWCTATRTVQAVGSATYSALVGKRSKARLQAMTL